MKKDNIINRMQKSNCPLPRNLGKYLSAFAITILQSVGAYANIIVVCPKLHLPDVPSASYYGILCSGQLNKALHVSGL